MARRATTDQRNGPYPLVFTRGDDGRHYCPCPFEGIGNEGTVAQCEADEEGRFYVALQDYTRWDVPVRVNYCPWYGAGASVREL
jgi:hypothetical protein